MAAAFGALHLKRARDLVEVIGGKEFSKEELDTISAAFGRISGPSSSTVDLAQFRQVLSLVHVTAGLPAERLFVLFDADGNGEIDKREFLTGLARLHGNPEEALRMCFSIFDADNSGFLSREELMSLLALNGLDLGEAAADGTTDEHHATRLADVFSRMDSDRDGHISFDEFKRALKTDPVVAEAVLTPLRRMRDAKPAC